MKNYQILKLLKKYLRKLRTVSKTSGIHAHCTDFYQYHNHLNSHPFTHKDTYLQLHFRERQYLMIKYVELFRTLVYRLSLNSKAQWLCPLKLNPQQRYTPPHIKYVLYRAPISVIAGGGILMPTPFAPLSIVPV